ncbi:hypothetical protein CY34DRAFT_346647 [Suillus luteus UH-Slu-Lm8-n1]|uniref:Uncharacterized protein n=1 Tax=Suillus luteus UH-Slu-Lm8-n1 TaxID=930992 RepID=A0A0C9ZNI6_9AGAM|nr:hypothetical protein CY34DRAFT_346647 [Suillus luteus UH-Slu-Lm8-n1]
MSVHQDMTLDTTPVRTHPVFYIRSHSSLYINMPRTRSPLILRLNQRIYSPPPPSNLLQSFGPRTSPLGMIHS